MLNLFFGRTPFQAIEVKADGYWHLSDRSTPDTNHLYICGYVVGWSQVLVSVTLPWSGRRSVFVLVRSTEQNEFTIDDFLATGPVVIKEHIQDSEKAYKHFIASPLKLLR